MASPREYECALSPCQEPFWFFERAGRWDANLVPIAVEVEGDFDRAAFLSALASMNVAHDALRSCVEEANGREAIFRVREGLCLPGLIEADLSTKPPTSESLQRRIEQDLYRPFDLHAPGLWRVAIYTLSSRRHVIAFVFHHLICDGSSAAIFLEHLFAIYATGVVKSPQRSYEDFARGHEDRLSERRRFELKAFWSSELGEAAEPVGFHMPPLHPTAGRWVSQPWTPADRAAVKALARALRLTPFMALLAAASVVLHRHTKSTDFVIGAPISLRPGPRYDDTIGCFVGTMPVRVRLAEAVTFADLAGAVRSATWRAIKHADAPFAAIVDAARPVRWPGHMPLFDVLLNVLSFPPPKLPLRLRLIDVPPPASRSGMTIYVDTKSGQPSMKAAFSPRQIDPDYARILLGQIGEVLAEAAADPQATLSCLPARRWTDGSAARIEAAMPIDEFGTVLDLIAAQVTRNPAAVAVEQGARRWSYGELDQAAITLLPFLCGAGTKKGDVVAVIGPRSFGMVAAMIALMRCGCVLLLLDEFRPITALQRMCREARAGGTIAVGFPAPAASAALGVPVILGIDALTGLPFPSPLPGSCGIWTGRAPASPGSDEAAYAFFTSGTTGMPRCVIGTHRGLAHFISWQIMACAPGPGDRVASVTGLSFDVILRETFLPLSSGATLCLPELGSGPLVDPAFLIASEVTLLHVVPSLARALLPTLLDRGGLKRLRVAFFAGEPLDRTLAERWREAAAPDCTVINLYGPTETTLAKSWFVVHRECLVSPCPIGRPLPGAEIYILGPELEPCRVGEIGEIVIRTPYRSLGYVGDRSCGGRFVRNPHRSDDNDQLYRTGDLGRRRADGTLEILGRIDQQIKINGIRCCPEEISSVLREHSEIIDAAVSLDPQDSDARLTAYVVRAATSCATAAEVRQFARHHLPSALVPARVMFLPELPRTANGKLDRAALPRFERLEVHSPDRPSTPLERAIADLWARHLNAVGFGIHESFFDLGGTSLDVLRLQPALSAVVGRQIEIASLMEHVTVSSLARFLDGGAAASVARTPPQRRRRTAVPGRWGEARASSSPDRSGEQ